MGEHNSPYFAQGRLDGQRDYEMVTRCPGQPAQGMDPDRAWSSMYQRGYDQMFADAQPHLPCENCQKDRGQ